MHCFISIFSVSSVIITSQFRLFTYIFVFYFPPHVHALSHFKYLGAWMENTDKDFKVRKALAWSACHKLRKIWTSTLSKRITIRLFIATVESVLLYGAETWTITQTMKKQLDGCYTRMLRMALNVSWKQHIPNIQLYSELPPVSTKVQQRRMRLAGHCVRHGDEVANKLVLWQPTDGHVTRGRQTMTAARYRAGKHK